VTPTPPTPQTPRTAALAALALLLAAPAAAQQSFTIPETPAFAFLGANPATIARPTTARDLAVALANGVDSTGRARQGVAVDLTPWLLWPQAVTNEAYRTRRGVFVLANTQLSLGTVRPEGDTSAMLAAVSVKTSLVDRGDPLASAEFVRRVREVTDGACRDLVDAETGRPDVEARLACYDRAVDTVRTAWLEDDGHWNDLVVSAAVAVGGVFPESAVNRLRYDRWAGWLTAGLPLGARTGQLLVHGRFDGPSSARDAASAGATWTLGVRALAGTSRVNGFVELLRSSTRDAPDPSRGEWSGGVELLTGERLWLSVGFGSTFSTIGDDRAVLRTGLRWNMGDEPRFLEALAPGR
jgi:hypothetical protein